ncbi:hypothetical protein KKA15_06455 [Patescibacteria group bacterium]|nr:hypothetical protein [Patescibacteria group bacterium]
MYNSILKTIAYFDIFDYPLTQFEVWKWLYKCQGTSVKVQGGSCRLLDVINELEQLVTDNQLETQNGFYFLPGRSDTVKIRMDRYNIAEIKYKKAIRMAKFFSMIPHNKMIAVCNTLGYSNSREGSDIDLFIITAKNRIWLTRLLSVFFLKILGLRPKGKKIKDKFCLSFFISEDNLNIENLGMGEQDIYFQFWVTQLVPIYNTQNLYEKFLDANSWVKSYLPNNFGFEPAQRRKVKERIRIIRKIWAKTTFNIDEKVAKKIQLMIMPNKLKSLANKDTRVVINDQILKFHENDRREIYRDLWQRKVASL